MADRQPPNPDPNPGQGNPGAPTPRPVPVPQTQTKPKPTAPDATAKARDRLIQSFRIFGFEEFARSHGMDIELSQNVTTSLVALYADVITSMWNTGFSQIDPVAVANIPGQAALLARNYIHSWMIDLYSSVRMAVQKKDAPIFIANFQTDIGFTGLKYDSFLNYLAAMLHPVQCNASLEETLYIWTFDLDTARADGNWFNLANVAAGDLTARRQNAIVDTFSRSKQVPMSLPKTGTSTGSGATLLDFYPRPADEENTKAYSWLNMTDNFTDTDLVIMFVIGQDFHATRLGPRFEFKTFIQADRNNFVAPFTAGNIIIEDTQQDNHVRGFHRDAHGAEVQDYANARDQAAEVATLYKREFWFYRKMHIQEMTLYSRQVNHMQIVKSTV